MDYFPTLLIDKKLFTGIKFNKIIPERMLSTMNLIKKAYCRTFQAGLKIALPFLPYRKPNIVGSVKALPDILQKHGCDRILIITDAGIMKLGLTRRLEKVLKL